LSEKYFLGVEHTSLSPSYSQLSFFKHYQSMFQKQKFKSSNCFNFIENCENRL